MTGYLADDSAPRMDTSHSPSPTSQGPLDKKRIRIQHLQAAKEQGVKISMLTAYDALTASIFDQAGIDMILVGDSLGNVVLGYSSTLPVTIEDMERATSSVAGQVNALSSSRTSPLVVTRPPPPRRSQTQSA